MLSKLVSVIDIAFVVLTIFHNLVPMGRSLNWNNYWRIENYGKSPSLSNLYFYWTFRKFWQFCVDIIIDQDKRCWFKKNLVFFRKRKTLHVLHNFVELFYVTYLNVYSLTPWQEKGNSAMLFTSILHENEIVPRFTSWYISI